MNLMDIPLCGMFPLCLSTHPFYNGNLELFQVWSFPSCIVIFTPKVNPSDDLSDVFIFNL
jgi:hypothetical protein